MRNIYEALRSLNINNYSLDFEPKTKEEFNSAFAINILDEAGVPTSTSRDTADFGVTWAQLVSADNLNALRKVRNKLLAETDFYALSDVTMSTEMTTYRQALRDITNTYTSIDDVEWPTKPE